jgi:hypothetical protein
VLKELGPGHTVRVKWVQQIMRECWRAAARRSPKQWRIGRRFYWLGAVADRTHVTQGGSWAAALVGRRGSRR